MRQCRTVEDSIGVGDSSASLKREPQTHSTYPGGRALARLRRPIYSNLLLAMRQVAAILPHNGYLSRQMYGRTRTSRCTSSLVTPASSTCAYENHEGWQSRPWDVMVSDHAPPPQATPQLPPRSTLAHAAVHTCSPPCRWQPTKKRT